MALRPNLSMRGVATQTVPRMFVSATATDPSTADWRPASRKTFVEK